MKIKKVIEKLHDAMVTLVVATIKTIIFIYDAIPAAPEDSESDSFTSDKTTHNPSTGLPSYGGIDVSGNTYGSRRQ